MDESNRLTNPKQFKDETYAIYNDAAYHHSGKIIQYLFEVYKQFISKKIKTPREQLSFLEIGCETGRRTEALLGITKHVWATENTPDFVNRAQSTAKLSTIMKVDPENSHTFPANKFDVIFILGRNI